jgi:hypothetical protein
MSSRNRSSQISHILQLLCESPLSSEVIWLRGGCGMGKTWFIESLRRRVHKELPNVRVLPYISGWKSHIYGLDECFSGHFGDTMTPEATINMFYKFTEFLKFLISGSEREFGRFLDAVDSVRIHEVTPSINAHNVINVKGRNNYLKEISLKVEGSDKQLVSGGRVIEALEQLSPDAPVGVVSGMWTN